MNLRARAADPHRGAGAGDAGVTLVELIVASAVSLLMLSLVGGLFVQIMHATADAQSTKTATGVAWTATNEITRVIRQGSQVPTSGSATEGAVIAGSTPTSLVLDAYVDSAVAASQLNIAPVRVTFSLNAAGKLLEQRVTGTLSGGYYAFSGTGTTRTVTGPLLTTGTGVNALFVYSDVSGAQVVPGATGLSSAQAATVTAVTVNVSVNNPLFTGSNPVLLTNEVTMPNIAIVNGGS